VKLINVIRLPALAVTQNEVCAAFSGISRKLHEDGEGIKASNQWSNMALYNAICYNVNNKAA